MTRQQRKYREDAERALCKGELVNWCNTNGFDIRDICCQDRVSFTKSKLKDAIRHLRKLRYSPASIAEVIGLDYESEEDKEYFNVGPAPEVELQFGCRVLRAHQAINADPKRLWDVNYAGSRMLGRHPKTVLERWLVWAHLRYVMPRLSLPEIALATHGSHTSVISGLQALAKRSANTTEPDWRLDEYRRWFKAWQDAGSPGSLTPCPKRLQEAASCPQ